MSTWKHSKSSVNCHFRSFIIDQTNYHWNTTTRGEFAIGDMKQEWVNTHLCAVMVVQDFSSQDVLLNRISACIRNPALWSLFYHAFLNQFEKCIPFQSITCNISV